MKLIRCQCCGDLVGLRLAWRDCLCRQSGGSYNSDGDTATVAGPCVVYGLSNSVFRTGRGEAWIYDELGKITRHASNTSDVRRA